MLFANLTVFIFDDLSIKGSVSVNSAKMTEPLISHIKSQRTFKNVQTLYYEIFFLLSLCQKEKHFLSNLSQLEKKDKYENSRVVSPETVSERGFGSTGTLKIIT